MRILNALDKLLDAAIIAGIVLAVFIAFCGPIILLVLAVIE